MRESEAENPLALRGDYDARLLAQEGQLAVQGELAAMLAGASPGGVSPAAVMAALAPLRWFTTGTRRSSGSR